MQTRPSKTTSLRSYVIRVFIALSITTWLVVPAKALTATEIISQARIFLNDNSADTGRQRFSDAQLLSFLNDGQREANIFSWVLKSSYTFELVSGTTQYALPSDFLTSWRVTLRGSKLDQTSFNQMDATSLGWQTSKGLPNKYYLYLASTSVIGFVPAPTLTSTGTVVVYYIQQPTEITSLSTSPWNGWNILAPYHSGLIYYITYRAYMSMQQNTLASQYFNEWTLYVNSLKEATLKMPDFNPGMTGARTQ